jgi:hypothetical protein
VIIIYYNANVKKKISLQQQQQSRKPTTLIMKLGQVVFTTRTIFLKHLLANNESQDKFINIDVTTHSNLPMFHVIY